MAIAKEGVPVVSPGGTFTATVLSIAEGDRGNTQVVVGCTDCGTGGGVFTLDLPHVPIRLHWDSETVLVISHPKEIQPHPSDPLARQKEVRFMAPGALADLERRLGGRASAVKPDEYIKRLKKAAKSVEQNARFVTIRYEQYSGAGMIAKLRRKEQSSPPPAPVANLLNGKYRGNLFAVGQGEYAYDYYDSFEEDSIAPMLQQRGYQGGGESWAGIVYGLLKLRAPEILQQVRLDPEAGGLRIWSSNRDSLTKVAKLVTQAHGDSKLLDLAIKAAEIDSEME
jgi:hypothetical protein